MQDSILVSFAILNTNWDQRRKSFVDNLVPFVADCLRTAVDAEVSSPSVQGCISERFGLDIPQHVIETVLSRAKKEHVVEQAGGILVRNDSVVAKYDLGRARDEVIRRYEALINAFRDYLAKEHDVNLQGEEADEAVLSYLEHRSLPVLRQMLRGPDSQVDSNGARFDFLVASFITHVCGSDPVSFSFLETVVKGSMLATALYLPTPGAMGGPISNLRVVLDTPFLLRALGYQGESQAAAGTELLSMLRRLGARLCCFPATLREMQGVLDACSSQLRSPRRKGDVPTPIVDYCLRNGLTSADVDVIRERVEMDLQSLGVQMLEPPPITIDLAVDEDELDEVLQNHVGYHRKEARLHDLDALTAIHRLRGGREQRHLESARAVFVTTNGRLVGASREFFAERPRGDLVPIAALDHELGTVVWLKSPMRAPDFPGKLILADAYAALNPSDEMWTKYLEAIDALSESQVLGDTDYALLRYSVEARRALMHETHGNPKAFTTGTVQDVLNEAKRQTAEDVHRELAEARSEAGRERASRVESERRGELERRREHELRRMQVRKIEARAEGVARFVSLGVFGTLVVACLAALVISLPEPFPDLITGGSRVLVIALSVLVAVGILVALSGAVFGESALSISGRFQEAVSRRLKPTLVRWFGPDDA